ncbi:MAG TPA: glycerol-3-phosphate dehydrogenase, partial [Azospirillum sp.]|nr:glycerol-3-phosphate dehydrogenase [Azospirillum sp.]
VWPLRFVLPHLPGLRPAWFLRLGLFLYDHLGGRKLLPGTRSLDLRTDPAGEPLKPGFSRAFEYSDCWVEDARLVVLNAQDAARLGATIQTRTRFLGAARRDGVWHATVEDTRTGRRSTVRARALVNAAGPWAADVLTKGLGADVGARIRLVQGSHIVVRRIFDHDRCYIFQNGDGRIVFAIPYERDFTLIGTTDRDYGADPAGVHASPEEIAYLCQAASEYFAKPIREEDVAWTYSGVRPLYDDGAPAAQAATRDYVLALDAPEGAAPLLTVFGGKITTYRKLAEAALKKLSPHLPAAGEGEDGRWSSRSPLPGGNFQVNGFQALVDELRTRYPFVEPEHMARLARAYGTRTWLLLGGASEPGDLGRVFGADLTEAEVGYLMREEWAQTAEDVLWRRSKLGLRLSAEQVRALDDFMAEARRTLVDASGEAAE